MLTLGGCGTARDTSSDPTPEPTESTSPAPTLREPLCADVWVDGQALPKDYEGCSTEDGWVEADARHCESGQVLVTFDDRFYAAKGFRVNDVGGSLSASAKYHHAVSSCG